MKFSRPLLAILLSCVTICATARTVTIPLEVARTEGCWFDARGARLLAEVPAPDNNGLIAIEAERPMRYFFDPTVRSPHADMPRDNDAAGGAYMDHATFASYEFIAEAAGEYYLWVRVRHDQPGRYRFRDVVNGTIWYFFDQQRNGDQPENEAPPRGWYWHMRRKVTLRKGPNRLQITRFGYRFPQIDRFVLAPKQDWEPSGTGPESTVNPVHEGWLETSSVRVPGLQRMIALQGLPDETAAVAWCVGDREWTQLAAVSAGGSVPINAGTPNEPIQFRVELASGPANADPGELCLVAEVDDERYVQLTSGRTRLVLDAQTAGLFLIQDAAGGNAIAMPGRPMPLVSIDFKRTGERRWIRVGPETVTEITAEKDNRGRWQRKPQQPEQIRTPPRSVSVGENSLKATWLLSADQMGRAELILTIEPDGDGFAFDVTARRLEGPADIVAVTFPRLQHVRVGRSGLDDRQFRMQSFGHEATQPGYSPLRDETYLGGLVMPWQEVYDGQLALYLGAHDPQAYNCLFTSERGGLAADHFSFATRKLDDIPAEATRSYHFELFVHEAPWHAGADRYRAWFEDQFGKAENPQFMRTFDGWLDLQAENYGRDFRFSDLPDWLTRARAIGLDWTQVWGQFAYDGGPCCHDFPALSPLYGGRQAWTEAVSDIVSRGGRVGGYFVYDRIDQLPLLTDWFLGHFRKSRYPDDTPWPSADFLTRTMLISDPAGATPQWPPPEEQIDTYRQRIDEHQKLYADRERARPVIWWNKVWINDPQWREYLRSWIADRYARDYGCNACYIDVLGCGAAAESYDPRRGHNGEGSWGAGKFAIARTVTESARQYQPDFAATMEGLGDLPGLYSASMCSGVYRGARNVMRYTFPDRILIHGTANPGSGGSSQDRYLETFLEAMRYDIVGKPTANAVYLLNLQRTFSPLLYASRFMDTAGLSVSDPRLKVRRHDLADGPVRGAILTIVNRQRLAGARVTLDSPIAPRAHRAFAVPLARQPRALTLESREQQLSFVAPQAMASQVLVVAAADGQHALWPICRLIRSPRPHLAVTILNLSDRSQAGRCAVELLGLTEPRADDIQQARRQLPLSVSETPFEVPAGRTTTVRYPVNTITNHHETVRARIAIRRNGAPDIHRAALITPLAWNGSFETIHGTNSQRAVHGQRVLELGPSNVGYQHQTLDLWLMPDRHYRLSVKCMRSGFDAQVHSTALVLRSHDWKSPIIREHMDTSRPDEWQTLTYEFDTPAELTRALLYLYNVRSPDTAWFDDVRVEDLGPVE